MTGPVTRAIAAMQAAHDPFRSDSARYGLVPARSVEEQANALIDAMEREWPLMATADRIAGDGPREEAAFEAAYAWRGALLDAAEALPTTCREARHAKALALCWLTAVQIGRGDRRADLGIDERLAFDIDLSLKGTAA